MREPALIHHDLCACEQCDMLHARPPLQPGQQALCLRCGAPLAYAPARSLDAPLALALSALVLLVVAHAHPIVAIEIQGVHQSATLWEAASSLRAEGAGLIALLVVLTTGVFPAVDMLAVVYLLLALRARTVPPQAHRVVRLMQAVRPWTMIEVFMLGVMVAAVKLAGSVAVITGPGLWAFGAVMLLLAGSAASLDLHRLWSLMDALQERARRGATRERP